MIARYSGLSESWLSKFCTGTKGDQVRFRTVLDLDAALDRFEFERKLSRPARLAMTARARRAVRARP